jgi:hypothetical protein
MSPTQKLAWYDLAVTALTLVVVFSLLPFLGYRAIQGLWGFGLLGLGPYFFRKELEHVRTDERDRLIRHRATTLAYAVFGMVSFPAVLMASLIYGLTALVPMWVLFLCVWWGLGFVFALRAIAILVQYARGPRDAEQ